MDYQAILDRILNTVDRAAYLTPSRHIDGNQREAMEQIERAIQSKAFDPDGTRKLIRRLHAEGQIERIMMLSALHVVAAHPAVADWAEAARLVGEQELAALEEGGPRLQANLASVERHRGVLAFLRGHPVVALDYFSRALERERSAENLGNVLCALIRLGEVEDAQHLLSQITEAYPASVVSELARQIAQDPDLALLRDDGEDEEEIDA